MREFTTDVDLRPAKNLLVRIDARLNSTTGLASWHLIALDPIIRQLPEDPFLGFLPPNRTPPEGDGRVLFTVMPKAGLDTGTEIRNAARIVFDVNPPIDTPAWLNTLDTNKPTSQVRSLAATQPAADFPVQWSGSDVGSGMLDYTIFVSENGAPATAWLRNTTATSGTLVGRPNTTYAFYSIGRDAAGNVEDPPSSPDTTTTTPAGPSGTPPPTGTSTPIGTRVSPGTATPTGTRTPAAPPTGLGFGISGGVSASSLVLTWSAAAAQSRHTLFRIAANGLAMLPVPPRAATYTDNPPAGMSCYALAPSAADLAASDFLCAVANARSGSAPQDFTLRLQPPDTASLNWTGPGGQTDYALWVLSGAGLRSVSMQGSETSSSVATGGQATCFILVANASGAAIGNTDILCGIPGTVGSATGPSGTPTAPANSPTPTNESVVTTTPAPH